MKITIEVHQGIDVEIEIEKGGICRVTFDGQVHLGDWTKDESLLRLNLPAGSFGDQELDEEDGLSFRW